MEASSLSALPPACRMARISELNSWPPGMPLKRMPVSPLSLCTAKLMAPPALASSRRVSLSEVETICSRKVRSSSRFACSPWPRTRVTCCCREAMYCLTASSMDCSSIKIPLQCHQKSRQKAGFCTAWRAKIRFCRPDPGWASGFPGLLPRRPGILRRRVRRRIWRLSVCAPCLWRCGRCRCRGFPRL